MFFFFLFSCGTYTSIFSSLNMIHIFKDFFVSHSHGNVIMCYFFFHEYYFALNMKHDIKAVR